MRLQLLASAAAVLLLASTAWATEPLQDYSSVRGVCHTGWAGDPVGRSDGIQAVLFYGSCLRSGDDRGGMIDLYVIVDRYRTAYRSWGLALLNRVLPPNVFYLEVNGEGRAVRAKYAVLSMADLERGTSRRWFHSYIWGRFAQPTAVLYARTPEAAERVHRALARGLGAAFLSSRMNFVAYWVYREVSSAASSRVLISSIGLSS